MTFTYYVTCVTPTGGRYRADRRAYTPAEARRAAEADGHTVVSVRKQPMPAGMGAPIRRRY